MKQNRNLDVKRFTDIGDNDYIRSDQEINLIYESRLSRVLKVAAIIFGIIFSFPMSSIGGIWAVGFIVIATFGVLRIVDTDNYLKVHYICQLGSGKYLAWELSEKKILELIVNNHGDPELETEGSARFRYITLEEFKSTVASNSERYGKLVKDVTEEDLPTLQFGDFDEYARR